MSASSKNKFGIFFRKCSEPLLTRTRTDARFKVRVKEMIVLAEHFYMSNSMLRSETSSSHTEIRVIRVRVNEMFVLSSISLTRTVIGKIEC